jgi:hypothetical protein
MELRTRIERLKRNRARPPPAEIPDTPLEFVESLGYHPYPYQVALLNAVLQEDADGNPLPTKTIMRVTRQGGKTECCCWLALWTALKFPGSSIIIISPSLRQSQIMMDRILTTWRGNKLVKGRDTALTLKLDNSSTIRALPGKSPENLRGFSCDLLLEDEAARCSLDLHVAAMPFLAACPVPRLVMVSTPWIRSGAFYTTWKTGKGWTRISATAAQCPALTKEYLNEQRQMLGPFYEVEYECQWLQSESNLFSRAVIDRCVTDDGEDLGWLLDAIVDGDDDYQEPASEGAEDGEISINDLPFDFEN